MNKPATAIVLGSALIVSGLATSEESPIVSGRLATIELEPEQSRVLQDVARQLIDGKLGPVLLGDEITFHLTRKPDHTHVTWQGEIEADGRFVDPDLIDAKLYADRCEIGLRLGKVVVK